MEFNEHGLQFGKSEWSECFELGSISALISLVEKNPVGGRSGGPISRSDEKDLTGNFTGLTLADKRPAELVHERGGADSLTKDRLTGLPTATGGRRIGLRDFSPTSKTVDSGKSGWRLSDSSNLFGEPASESASSNAPDDSPTDCTKRSAYDRRLIGQYWNYTMKICQCDQLVKRKFNFETYDQLENNCLDFVFFFFKLLDLEPFEELPDKRAFCERLVKPRLSELFKIIEFDRSDQSGYLVVRNDFKPATEKLLEKKTVY